MWSSGSHNVGNERKNSPPLKDFNIFDTLKPEKVETFGTDNVTTGLLVDITDSDTHTGPKLLGSLLDVKKNEYSLVDLFQNLYVTPQHVRSKNSDLDLMFDDSGPVGTPSSNIDAVNREIDTKNAAKDDSLEDRVRSFDEIFDSAVSSRNPNLEFSGTSSKDTIDGLIKTIQTCSTNGYDKAVDYNLNTGPYEITNSIFDVTIPKPVTNSFNTDIFTTNITAEHESPIIKTNDVYKPVKVLKPPKIDSNIKPHNTHVILKPSNPIDKIHTPFKDSHIFDNISDIHLQSLKQNGPKETKKDNLFQSDSVTRYRKDIETSLLDLNKPPIALIKNTQPIPVLQTVKKDNKQFNKRRIIKKDSDKIGYTKGPDIYEKSVVLPQIMQRLGERKRALDIRKNLKKKLVLDKGEISKDNGSFGPDNFRMVNKNIDLPKLSPQVLMEDCNKERLKALKLRTAFETFVLSGQI